MSNVSPRGVLGRRALPERPVMWIPGLGSGGSPALSGVPMNFAITGLTLAVSHGRRGKRLHVRTRERHVVVDVLDERDVGARAVPLAHLGKVELCAPVLGVLGERVGRADALRV